MRRILDRVEVAGSPSAADSGVSLALAISQSPPLFRFAQRGAHQHLHSFGCCGSTVIPIQWRSGKDASARPHQPAICADDRANEPSRTDAKVGDGGSTPLDPTICSISNSDPTPFESLWALRDASLRGRLGSPVRHRWRGVTALDSSSIPA